jgi:hypothetical protein
MSYEIVKSIQNRDGHIWLNATSNNVWGVSHDIYGRKHYYRPFRWYEWEWGTDYLAKHGEHGLMVLIADDILAGNIKFTSGRFNKFRASIPKDTFETYYALSYDDPDYVEKHREIARKAWEAFAGTDTKLRKPRGGQ